MAMQVYTYIINIQCNVRTVRTSTMDDVQQSWSMHTGFETVQVACNRQNNNVPFANYTGRTPT